MYSANGISIAFSSPERFSEQGLMLRFSGEGIAYYEKHRKQTDKKWNWITFLKEFFSLGIYGLQCKCTRIDLAFDDISYDSNRLIDLNIMGKAIEKGELVSLFRNIRFPNDTNEYIDEIRHEVLYNTSGKLRSNTIYFGNRKGVAFCRFYDKRLEQISKKQPIDDKIKSWVRMEFEFKQNRAMSVCDSLMLLSSEEFGTYFSQVVNRYIRFVKPNGEDRKHYYRCKSQKWWKKIVGTVEKARLVENKAYKNKYRSTMYWLRKAVYPTLWAVLHCHNVDDFLTDVQQFGYEHHSAKHEDIIQDFVNQPEDEHFKGLEIHRATTGQFTLLLLELESAAFGARMRQLGYNLCEALDLQKEYYHVHKVNLEGTQGRNIDDFRSRKFFQQQLYMFLCGGGVSAE